MAASALRVKNARFPENSKTGSLAPNSFISEKSDDRLPPNEIASLRALIAYVAAEKGADSFGVETLVQGCFRVAFISDLRRADFDAVVRFLVNLCDDTQRPQGATLQ